MPTRTPEFIYGTAWKEGRTAGLTELAIGCGFRAIDTANQRRHYFEEGVGQGLAAAYQTGVVTRDDLFLQTKFTYRGGQDDRLPYDPSAPLATQVVQSLSSSLRHLGTDRVDSFVLHGPSSGYSWTDADTEVWEAMRRERDEGRTILLGVSNVSLLHLEQMEAAGLELPTFVQNRCFARLGWDRDVRQFCKDHNMVYQGFSLLTANQEVVHNAAIVQLAEALNVTSAQLIFSFARSIGILPLTGTSNAEHMMQDLESIRMKLSADIVQALEGIAG